MVSNSGDRCSHGHSRRSKSNHRCCYNPRYRNEVTKHLSDSTSSSSVSSSAGKRKRSSSSAKTSSGYGCSDPKYPRTQYVRKRRSRSSHVSHPKSGQTTDTSKAVRICGDEVHTRDYRSDSSPHSYRSAVERSHANLPSNANVSRLVTRDRRRIGNHPRRRSPEGHLHNGAHASPHRPAGSYFDGPKRERKAQRRRDERAQRKLSHEGHKRKSSPVVTVGDVIKRRYRVEEIIGEGSYGQVFQCFDLCTNSLTAVKALKPQNACKDAAKHELHIIDKISRADSNNRSHCIVSLDFFDWHSQFFLVFPLLGPSVFSFLEQNNYDPYPVEHSASIIRQLCESVDFLHRIGITHTDLKPENILFVDGSYDEVHSENRNRKVRRLRNPDIKLIDFGSATFDGDRRPTTIQTRHYRAPEVVIDIGWDQSADTWSIGCILFELITGQCLFMTHDNLEHLAMMERVLGALPKSMIKSSRRRRYFRHGRLDWPENSSDARHVRKALKPLGEYWYSYSDMYVRLAFDLIREMLVYIPSHRISCYKALEHPFILSFDN